MKWAWFSLAAVALALGLVGGLYAAGPSHKTVNYFATVQREGYCAGETTEWFAPGGIADEEECSDLPSQVDSYCAGTDFPECQGSGEWDVYWVAPRKERVPATRLERTNAWERITQAVTG
jgi:hypothetical protein